MVKLNLDVPEDFYKEETRSGCYVSPEKKKLWAVQLDLLNQLQNTCEKFNLQYFALGGTLLGAARHKGYIPWDDDIDIIMPRTDYDRFIEIALREYQDPYFLSYPLTEKNFWTRHIVLRNSMTTGFKVSDKNRFANKGIYIDIMPMDTVPATREERDKHRSEIRHAAWWGDKHTGINRRIRKKASIPYYMMRAGADLVVRCKGMDNIFRNFEQVLTKYDGMETGYLGHASISYRERGIWPEEWYRNSLLLDFEFIKIKVPVEYMKVLFHYYGDDCMKIPEKYPSTAHGEIEFDADTPFTQRYEWKRRT